MPRNKLSDLNNHLFAQLERLNDEEAGSEKMELEIKKAKAISQVATEILKSSKLSLNAARLVHEGYINEVPDNMKQLSESKNGVIE